MMTTTCDEEKGWAENSPSGRWTLLCSTEPASMMILDDIFFLFFFSEAAHKDASFVKREMSCCQQIALAIIFSGNSFQPATHNNAIFSGAKPDKAQFDELPRHEPETRGALNFNKQNTYARCCQARLLSLCLVICIKKIFMCTRRAAFPPPEFCFCSRDCYA